MNLSITINVFKHCLPLILDELMITMIETLPVNGSVSIIFQIRQCKNQGKQFLNTLIVMLKLITFMLLQN